MWTYNYTDELYHYGVKGMKWGVRRREIREARDRYRKLGASKKLSRKLAVRDYQEYELSQKGGKALKRLGSRYDDPKYSDRQRAKDYQTALRTLQQLRGKVRTDAASDHNDITPANRAKIEKLNGKKQTERRIAKAKQYMKDNDIMLSRNIAAINRSATYNQGRAAVLDMLRKDNKVVYTTNNAALASTESRGSAYISPYGNMAAVTSTGYEFTGTNYNVRANTKSRAKRKKYTDQNRKKEYEEKLNRYNFSYAYY